MSAEYSLANPPRIKPCPFCGHAPKLVEAHGEGYTTYGRFWYAVVCHNCDIGMSDREEWDGEHKLKLPPMECVERWNKRG